MASLNRVGYQRSSTKCWLRCRGCRDILKEQDSELKEAQNGEAGQKAKNSKYTKSENPRSPNTVGGAYPEERLSLEPDPKGRTVKAELITDREVPK
jgi:hypothetical protein